MIHNIVKAVILIYMQDLSGLPELDDWVTCKQVSLKATWVSRKI